MIHTPTYTLQSVPGGSFQVLLQPIETPLECTRYTDHLRRGLGRDCQAQKAYEMPMGGAGGAHPQRVLRALVLQRVYGCLIRLMIKSISFHQAGHHIDVWHCKKMPLIYHYQRSSYILF